MALYELRTYTFHVGRLGEAVSLYHSEGWPALQKYEDKLVGYFTGDIGAMNPAGSSVEIRGRRRPAAALGCGIR